MGRAEAAARRDLVALGLVTPPPPPFARDQRKEKGRPPTALGDPWSPLAPADLSRRAFWALIHGLGGEPLVEPGRDSPERDRARR